MKSIIAVLITLPLFLTVVVQGHADGLTIGIIPTESLPMGCGMQFWDRKFGSDNKAILIDKDLNAIWLKMVINGKLRVFQNFRKTGKVKKAQDYTVGDSFVEEYGANGINITIKYRITKVCPENNKDCESTYYEGEATIKTKDGRQLHYQLNGSGGC